MSFAEAQAAFFADFFRHYPVHATDAGNHEHDGRWMDLTESGTAERLAWLADVRAHLEALVGLDREEDIDRRVLLRTVDELRFEEELDEASWSPIVYVYLLGGGLFSLLSREFAPVADRLASAIHSNGPGPPGAPSLVSDSANRGKDFISEILPRRRLQPSLAPVRSGPAP